MEHLDLLALVARVNLFADLDAAERDIVARLLQPFALAPGEVLVRQGAAADGLYLVADGSLVVTARIFGGEELALAEVGPGEAVGQIALVDRQARSATVRARTAARGGFLDTRSFDRLRANLQPSALKLLLRVGAGLGAQLRRLDQALAALPGTVAIGGARVNPALARPLGDDDRAWLRMLPALGEFTDAELGRLAGALRALDLRRGEVLVRAGEDPDAVYLVVRGAVAVHAGPPEACRRRAVLGPGRFFAVLAALDGLPQPTSFVAREDTRVHRLAAADARALLADPGPLAFGLADAFARTLSEAVRAGSRLRAQLGGEEHPAAVVHASSS